LLEYICPGRKDVNLSQSSLKAFISEANHTDPEIKQAIHSLLRFGKTKYKMK
jgi:hypothetical protein